MTKIESKVDFTVRMLYGSWLKQGNELFCREIDSVDPTVYQITEAYVEATTDKIIYKNGVIYPLLFGDNNIYYFLSREGTRYVYRK